MNAGAILILEDDEGIAVLEQNSLRRAGYTVENVRDTQQADARIAAGGISLIVLDYNLNSGPNGVDFFKALRSKGVDIPGILVTGLSDENRIIEAMRAGIRDFVPKRTDFLDHLKIAVDRVMQQINTEQQLIRSEEERRVSDSHNRIKDEFLAMLSHELRTPMTSILGWTRILKQGNVEESVMAKALQVIERNAKAQIDLINDLLDVSRIITGKLELSPEEADLVALINGALDAVRPATDLKGLVLKALLPDGPVNIHADPVRLQQIFNNLFSNAIKFTPAGGTILVEMNADDQRAEVLVSDTGAGIDPEFLPYIFDRFRQEDSSITRKHQGLGIGLSIARHLIELHGGTIQAESNGRNMGSTFTLIIPRKIPSK